MKTGLILARVDSSRLPGKALITLGHQRLIDWPISALKSTATIRPILLTSDREVDRPLIEIAKSHDIEYYRGSFENIALRIKNCIIDMNIQGHFARINGDSPFLNLDLIKQGFSLIDQNPDIDFVSNILERKYPYGSSVEIINTQTFIKEYDHISHSHPEHITGYFYVNKDKFEYKQILYAENDAHSIRFVVDNFSDLQDLEDFLIYSGLKGEVNKLNIDELIRLYNLYKQEND